MSDQHHHTFGNVSRESGIDGRTPPVAPRAGVRGGYSSGEGRVEYGARGEHEGHDTGRLSPRRRLLATGSAGYAPLQPRRGIVSAPFRGGPPPQGPAGYTPPGQVMSSGNALRGGVASSQCPVAMRQPASSQRQSSRYEQAHDRRETLLQRRDAREVAREHEPVQPAYGNAGPERASHPPPVQVDAGLGDVVARRSTERPQADHASQHPSSGIDHRASTRDPNAPAKPLPPPHLHSKAGKNWIRNQRRQLAGWYELKRQQEEVDQYNREMREGMAQQGSMTALDAAAGSQASAAAVGAVEGPDTITSSGQAVGMLGYGPRSSPTDPRLR
ncbi:uncharacterized protein LTR77_008706 [Saxophila tyrrhenica]|uniref:Uncharacterized protein n=1 Tax=Saxophila tyrrhenica TaxID=1690608 RepID=A0AAV9P3C3_9PEZI|nr:hypothetical protein LTR77_008706 [Saxophila tyrrhenica]